MSLKAAMAAVAEVAGEVPGIVRWYPTLQGTIDASSCPAVMTIRANGGTGIADVPATNYVHNYDIVCWLIVAPATTDLSTGMDRLTGLVDPVMEHLYQSWARTPRHPLFSWFRRLGPITYNTDQLLEVGGTAYIGAAMTVAVQEDRRVQHP